MELPPDILASEGGRAWRGHHFLCDLSVWLCFRHRVFRYKVKTITADVFSLMAVDITFKTCAHEATSASIHTLIDAAPPKTMTQPQPGQPYHLGFSQGSHRSLVGKPLPFQTMSFACWDLLTGSLVKRQLLGLHASSLSASRVLGKARDGDAMALQSVGWSAGFPAPRPSN